MLEAGYISDVVGADSKLKGRLHRLYGYLLLGSLVRDEKPAVWAFEAAVAGSGATDQRGLERLRAMRADDRVQGIGDRQVSQLPHRTKRP